MKHILKCKGCGTYTLNGICSKCNGVTVTIRPPKWSPDDKFADYRRKAKENDFRKRGLT